MSVPTLYAVKTKLREYSFNDDRRIVRKMEARVLCYYYCEVDLVQILWPYI